MILVFTRYSSPSNSLYSALEFRALIKLCEQGRLGGGGGALFHNFTPSPYLLAKIGKPIASLTCTVRGYCSRS